MANELDALVKSVDDKYVIPFIQDLIKTPSLSGEEEKVAKIIAAKMKELKYDEVTIDEQGNVTGLIKGKNHKKKIFFNGHIDHVDPGMRSAWKDDPYSAKIKDGRMFGRGTVDMKASVGVAVLGLGLLKKHNIQPECDIYMMCVVHEETREGVSFEYLFNKFGIPNACVIGEATEMDLKIGHRGRTEIEIETYGKTGHSSMPHLADNAAYKMAPVITAINEINVTLPEHPFLGKATAAIIYMTAWPNLATAVLDRCQIVVDRRTIVGEKEADLINEIKTFLTKKGLKPDDSWLKISVRKQHLKCWTGLEVDTKAVMPGWYLDKEHPVTNACVKGLKNLNINPKLKRWEFSTDGNWSMGEKNVPTIGYGPGDEKLAHQPNENIALSDLLTATKGNAAIALELAKAIVAEK